MASATHKHEKKRGGAKTTPHESRSADSRSDNRRRLFIVLLLTTAYTVAEAVGGWLTGSLALFADAGHMVTDVAALALALAALWFAARPATPQKTYGYYRLEILAAFVNGVALVLVSLWIFYEAVTRLAAPPEVNSRSMTFIAAGGLAVNLICAWLLHDGRAHGHAHSHSHDGHAHDHSHNHSHAHSHSHDLNMHGAWLHIVGDALGSLGTIIAGALIWAFGWRAADPLISIGIGLLIIWSSWRLIKDATNVLLEGAPAHINLAAVERAILETEGVAQVHDLHVWTITSGREALSAHVIHTQTIAPALLLKSLRLKLRERFGVDHLTIQMETADYDDETFHFCHSGTACFRSDKDET